MELIGDVYVGGKTRGGRGARGTRIKSVRVDRTGAPTRKARHDHLTLKLRRESTARTAEIRLAARPYRNRTCKINMPQREPYRPQATLLPLLLRATVCSSAAVGSSATATRLPRAQPLRRGPDPRARRRRRRPDGMSSARRRLRRPHLMGGDGVRRRADILNHAYTLADATHRSSPGS